MPGMCQSTISGRLALLVLTSGAVGHGTVVIIPIGRVRNRVIGEACEIVVRESHSLVLTCDKVLHWAKAVRSALAFPSSDCIKGNDSIVEAHLCAVSMVPRDEDTKAHLLAQTCELRYSGCSRTALDSIVFDACEQVLGWPWCIQSLR